MVPYRTSESCLAAKCKVLGLKVITPVWNALTGYVLVVMYSIALAASNISAFKFDISNLNALQLEMASAK
jgi:hypothetical protein